MSQNYLTISIKNTNEAEVWNCLRELEVQEVVEKSVRGSAIKVDVYDLTDEFEITRKFLKENHLKDHTEFYQIFDATGYGLIVDFSVFGEAPDVDMLEMEVFIIAKRISVFLQTSCFVMFSNGEIPAGLFDEGVLKESFEELNFDFFKRKPWRPKK